MRTFLFEIYEKVSIFFTEDFSREFLALKIFGYLLSLFLFFLIVLLLRRADAFWWVREMTYAAESVKGEEALNKKWQKILQRLERGDDANLKLAVIEADNIFADILKRMSLPGENFEERLGQFEHHELQSVDLVWEAHRLRDFIVNQPKVLIEKEQAETAVKYYEGALKELEYLE